MGDVVAHLSFRPATSTSSIACRLGAARARVGNCVYYVPPNWVPRTSPNQELEGHLWPRPTARELAMDRLQREAEQPGVAGVVGVTVTQESHSFWRGATEFLAYGTAVRLKRDGGQAWHRSLDVRSVVGLDDPFVATDPSAITG